MTLRGLSSYLAYKPSGVEWLGEVPMHWDVRRGKALLVPVDVRSTTGDEELLTVSAQRGVVPRETANVTMFKAESYVGYKLCWPGDLVINSLWAWAHGLGVSWHHGIVSSAYGVYRPLPKADARFIHLLVRSVTFQWELQVRSKGIWVSRLQLTDEAFLGAPFPLPPIPEQRAIVRYLDYVDRRIRRYVGAKRRLIALLEEEKQAIVNQAVTRGLDPNVRLKPSGVESLGDVPEHWGIMSMKHLGTFKSGAGFPVERQGRRGEEVPFFKVSDMNLPGNDVYLNSWNNSVSREVAATLKAPIFPAEAIMFPKVGGAMLTNKRRVATRPSSIDNNLMGFVLTRGAHAFVLHLMRNIDLGLIAKPGPVPAVSEGEVGAIRVALPPLDQQAAIAEHLDKANADADARIAHARRQIELVQEYRTRLIADVVTGKLDVREAAAQLPDEADDQDPIEESDPLADGMPEDLYDIDESVEDSVVEQEVTV